MGELCLLSCGKALNPSARRVPGAPEPGGQRDNNFRLTFAPHYPQLSPMLAPHSQPETASRSLSEKSDFLSVEVPHLLIMMQLVGVADKENRE